MKWLLKIIPLPIVVLASVFSILFTVTVPEKVEAYFNCPGNGVAAVRGDYASCTQPGSSGGMTCSANQVAAENTCFTKATNVVIRCEAGKAAIVAGDGRERCYSTFDGGAACGQGQRRFFTKYNWVGDPEAGSDQCLETAQAAAARAGGNTPGGGSDGNPAPGGADEDKEEPTCGTMATNIGWYTCPLLNAATEFADGMWALFENMLIIPPLSTQGDTAPLYAVWGTLRNIANVILTILFLIVIFSQVSSLGISNYGIKKMLPKLLITAVAINISFFLMQIAIDLSNILTAVVGDVIRGAGGSIEPVGKGLSLLVDEILVGLVAAAAAGTGAAIIGGAMAVTGSPLAVILFLVILMIPVVFGLVAGVLTLALRSLILPILVIFAPIAFALQLLPNTKKMADKWTSITMGLLMFSVVAAILYDGAVLVLTIVVAVNDNSLIKATAYAALFLLMFFLPFMAFKINPMTKSAFNSLRGGLNKLSGRPVKALTSANNAALSRGAKARYARFKNRDTPAKAGWRNPVRKVGNLASRGAQRAAKSLDTSKRNAEMDIGYEEQVAQQSHREGVLYDNKRMARMEQTPTGRAYIAKFESEASANKEQAFLNQSDTFMAKEFKAAAAAGDALTMNAILSVKAKTGGDPGPKEIKRMLEDNHSTMVGNGSYEKVLNNLSNNHDGLMSKDLELKEMMNNIYADDGKTVTPLSPSEAKTKVANNAQKIAKDKLSPEKFAALTNEQKETVLQSPAFRPHLDDSLLVSIFDKDSATSGRSSTKVQEMASSLYNSRNSGGGGQVAGGAAPSGGTPGGGGGASPGGGGGTPQPTGGGNAPATPTTGGSGGGQTANVTNNTTSNTTTNNTTTTQTAVPGYGSGFNKQNSPPSPTGQAPTVIVSPPAGGVTPSSAPVTAQNQPPTIQVNVQAPQPPTRTPMPGYGSGFGQPSSPPSSTGQSQGNQPRSGGSGRNSGGNR